jgi:DNA-binding NtrC family response regulator
MGSAAVAGLPCDCRQRGKERKLQTLDSIAAAHLQVLVVEDEPRLRELLLEVIPDMGFGVTAARSAEEAGRIMQQNPHDIILLDLQLPGMNGMEFFEQLRGRWPRTQVIVATGFGNLETARRAIRLDVVDFLTKPCHLRDLEVALERARRRIIAREPSSLVMPDAPSAAVNHPAATLRESERELILAALARNEGNRSATAAQLGISRRTLYYRLRQYARGGWFID